MMIKFEKIQVIRSERLEEIVCRQEQNIIAILTDTSMSCRSIFSTTEQGLGIPIITCYSPEIPQEPVPDSEEKLFIQVIPIGGCLREETRGCMQWPDQSGDQNGLRPPGGKEARSLG